MRKEETEREGEREIERKMRFSLLLGSSRRLLAPACSSSQPRNYEGGKLSTDTAVERRCGGRSGGCRKEEEKPQEMEDKSTYGDVTDANR